MINFENEFRATKGKPFVVDGITYRMSYDLEPGDNANIKVHIIKFDSSPRQGIRFDSEFPMNINGKQSNAFSVWADKAPHDFLIECVPNSKVSIRNIWDNGDGVEQSWHAGGAMIVENKKNLIVCRTNSTLLNDFCNDLEVTFELIK